MWVSKAEWDEFYEKFGGHGNRIYKLETKFAGDMQTAILKDRVKALENRFESVIKVFKKAEEDILVHVKERTELLKKNNTAQEAHLDRHEKHNQQVELFLSTMVELIKKL